MEFFQDLLEELYVKVNDCGTIGKGKNNFGVESIEIYEMTNIDSDDVFYVLEFHECNEIPYDRRELRLGDGQLDFNNMLDNYDRESIVLDTRYKEIEFKNKEELNKFLTKYKRKNKVYETLKECMKDTKWIRQNN